MDIRIFFDYKLAGSWRSDANIKLEKWVENLLRCRKKEEFDLCLDRKVDRSLQISVVLLNSCWFWNGYIYFAIESAKEKFDNSRSSSTAQVQEFFVCLVGVRPVVNILFLTPNSASGFYSQLSTGIEPAPVPGHQPATASVTHPE